MFAMLHNVLGMAVVCKQKEQIENLFLQHNI